MKAIILAAGKGERLGNITNHIPKPMIKINEKPILEHNIQLCKKFGITNIYINLYHLPNIITDYFGHGGKYGAKITYIFEKELLGTSGAVKNISNLDSSFKLNPFYVLYGDNYSNYNLDLLKSESKTNIAFHYREDVINSGVAEFDKENKIISFIEKPKKNETSSHWVNAGIYYLQPKILDFIPNVYSDFAKDIFPLLLKNNFPIYGVCENIELKAFDTPEMLIKNNINLQ